MRLLNVLIALDQLANTLVGGWPDESISARCWRLRTSKPYCYLRPLIDGLFFWQDGHCEAAYQSERERRHLPPEERQISN